MKPQDKCQQHPPFFFFFFLRFSFLGFDCWMGFVFFKSFSFDYFVSSSSSLLVKVSESLSSPVNFSHIALTTCRKAYSTLVESKAEVSRKKISFSLANFSPYSFETERLSIKSDLLPQAIMITFSSAAFANLLYHFSRLSKVLSFVMSYTIMDPNAP